MFQAFVYRLYPSQSQRARLEAVRETCRHFYNACRRERKEAYEERGETISQTVQLRKVKVEKATSPYALDIHSHILQNVVADLDKAFEAFFRRVKAGENPGYPRFKVRNRFAGFGFKEYGNRLQGRWPSPRPLWHRPDRRPLAPHARRDDQDGPYLLPGGQVVRRLLLRGREARTAAEDRGIDGHRSWADEVGHVQQWREEREPSVVSWDSPGAARPATKDRTMRARQPQPSPVDPETATHDGSCGQRRKDFLNKFVHELITRFDRIVLEDLRVAASVAAWCLASAVSP